MLTVEKPVDIQSNGVRCSLEQYEELLGVNLNTREDHPNSTC